VNLAKRRDKNAEDCVGRGSQPTRNVRQATASFRLQANGVFEHYLICRFKR
jgi:hypothetical protein